jgi:putative endonuclease
VKDYYVYIMTNRSRVVVYVGMTSRLDSRVWDHKNHVVEGFTSRYDLDRLVYYEQFCDLISAITREKEIKGWRRAKKNALIETLNPKWEDLTGLLFGDTRTRPKSKGRSRHHQYRQSS